MDCTQVLVASDEEENVPDEDERRQVASLNVNEKSFPIFLGDNKIGRDASSCSVVIANMALSSQHAVIQGLECGMFLIYDLNSRNKTKLGKMTLTPNVRYQLRSGDVVRLANVLCKFHFEKDFGSNSSSSRNDRRNDIPCTQVIEGSDGEDVATEAEGSEMQDTLGDVCPAVKHPNKEKDHIKVPKTLIKKTEEHLFKMPEISSPKSVNDSFGYLNESKNSSCRLDSDDEIFDLLTQPSGEEPQTSKSVTKNKSPYCSPGCGPPAPLNNENEKSHDDDIFSAATEDFIVTPKKSTPKATQRLTWNEGNAVTSEEELTDGESIFSLATEASPCPSINKKESGANPKDLLVRDSGTLKEGEITGEEDIFSAAAKGFCPKPKEKSTQKADGKAVMEKDAWEEFGVTDEDDIFSAATEAFPVKANKDSLEESRKDNNEGNNVSKESEATDEEDIFSAATEAFPMQPNKKKTSKMKSRGAGTKEGEISEEDDISNEVDVFSAETEALPLHISKKKESKLNPRKGMAVDGATSIGGVSDEEDIFSAATEDFAGKLKEKDPPQSNSKGSFSINKGSVSSEIHDPQPGQIAEADLAKSDGTKAMDFNQEQVFSADTKGLLPLLQNDKNKEEGELTKSSNVKAVQEGVESCDNEGFVKDLLSTSGSQELCVQGNKAAVSNTLPVTAANELVSSQRSDGSNRIGGESADKSREHGISSQEIKKPGVEVDSDGDATDVEDESLYLSTREKTQGHSELKSVMKGSSSESEKSTFAKSDNDQSQAKLTAPECGPHVGGISHLNNTSFEVISDTEDEDDEENCIDSTMENSNQNKTVKSSSIGSVYSGSIKSGDAIQNAPLASSEQEVSLRQQGEKESKSVMMTIDETLPTTCVILTKKDIKLSGDNPRGEAKGDKRTVADETQWKDKENKKNERQTVNGSKKQNDLNSKTLHKNIKDDTCDKSEVSNPGPLQNESSVVEKDEDVVFVAETPVCARISKRGKDSQVENGVVDVEDEEEDMSSFLTEAPPEFKTPVIGVKGLTTGLQDLSEFEIQPTPKSTAPCAQGKAQIIGEADDDEEEDMSSFLTQAPPEFKTPETGLKKLSDDENDLSELQTQPAPNVTHTPCKDKNESDDQEDMSSFLTEAPPEFKTPLVGVRKIMADEGEEDDISDLATQPTPNCGEKQKDDGEEEDMSSFLTEAPPEFKTPVVGVQKIIAEEDDLSDLVTQPAPRNEEKQQDDGEKEDMSSFLTEAPPEFKTPRIQESKAGVRKIIVEEEEDDISDLATQPAPKCLEKQQDDGEEEDMSSFLTEAPPEFKTPVAGVRKIIEEEDDISDLATQPAPTCVEKQQDDGEEEDMSSFLTEAPPEFKTPVAGLRKIIVEEEEDDISDLATQPAPTCVEKQQDDGHEEDMSSFLTEAPPEFKTPVVGARKIMADEEEEDDMSDLATQPAPCVEKDQDGIEKNISPFLIEGQLEFKTPKVSSQKLTVEEEEEDLSNLATQPAPVCDEMGMNERILPSHLQNEFKSPKDTVKYPAVEEEEEDLSDLATQPAPTCDETKGNEEKNVDSFCSEMQSKVKTPAVGTINISEEEDLCDFVTQPAPVIEGKDKSRGEIHGQEKDHHPGFKRQPAVIAAIPRPTRQLRRKKGDLQIEKSATMQIKQEVESEEDLSLLDTQPAPHAKASSKSGSLNKDKLQVTDLMRENVRRKKALGVDFSSPKTGKKVSKISSRVETPVEDDGSSSETDFELSMALPDTPELLGVLKESGNKFIQSQTSCKNLFDVEVHGTVASSIASPKVLPKEEAIKLPASGKSKTTVKKEKMKPHVVKATRRAKSSFDEKDAICPPKKLNEIQDSEKRSDRTDLKNKDSLNDSKKVFTRGMGVTLIGVNKIQKSENTNLEKRKSQALPHSREMVVTSTPIHTSVVSSKHGETLGSADAAEKKASIQPTRRGRRKAGGAIGDAGHLDSPIDLVSPVCVGDPSEIPQCIKMEDAQSKNVHDAQKSRKLRLRKPPDSNVAAKEGKNSSKEPNSNPQTREEPLHVDESSVSSSNTQSMFPGKKRNISASVVEVTPVTQETAKVKKTQRKKIESEEIFPVSDKNQTGQSTEKSSNSKKSHEGECLGETSSSSNIEAEISPIIFYRKHQRTLKSNSPTISNSGSLVDTLKRKKTQGDDSHSQNEKRNTIESPPKPIRRSGRDKKPKKRFSVENSPAEAKRSKGKPKSEEPIPIVSKTTRERKNFADSITLSDSGVNSSPDLAVSSDSTASTSKKRTSDDDQDSRCSKRSRTSDDDISVGTVTRGGSRGRNREVPSPLKPPMGPPAPKSNDKSKLLDGNALGPGATLGRGEKKGSQELQDALKEDAGDRRSTRGRGRRNKEPLVPEVHHSTRVKEEVSDTKQDIAQHQATGRRVGQRLREGTSSESPQVSIVKGDVSRVNQVDSSKGRSVEDVEMVRKRRNESIAANDSKVSSSTEEAWNESISSKSKSNRGGETTSTNLRKRRKISPKVTNGSTEENKVGKRRGENSSSPKVVPPLKISRGQVVTENVKDCVTVALDSPVYNQSILAERGWAEKPTRCRKQKKDTVNVLFTGLNDPKLGQIVEKLGGSVVQTPQECTVLVTDRLRRTYKLLCAIARGIPIVTSQWLSESSSSCRFLDPMDFLVSDKVTEKRFDFTLKSSLEKARIKPVLTGYSFIATPSVKPPPEEVKGIVTCAGGQYVSSLKAAESRVTHLFYVVSCVDDSGVWDEYTGVGVKRTSRSRAKKDKGAAAAKEEGPQAKLVGVEGLLVSVLRQKDDLESKDFILR
ncbi:mediator of DNA damage checkpoint protein 1-like [Hetaerina americana]|uniref:mediator of DNA damage checkpoint protein 1-like n=1 Tax=Hetaerina americana TaxID=62018 RepID=UPI003A7F1A00